ncbi:MAG: hypothetical protein QOF16_1164 [Actinomycetota bacterium]|nr:hypothetical protein [Actinomycetota bacterium]
MFVTCQAKHAMRIDPMSQLAHDAISLSVGESMRFQNVERELGPGRCLVGMLPTRPPRPRESQSYFRLRDR